MTCRRKGRDSTACSETAQYRCSEMGKGHQMGPEETSQEVIMPMLEVGLQRAPRTRGSTQLHITGCMEMTWGESRGGTQPFL